MRSETFDETRARMLANDATGQTLGDARWDRGDRLTVEERAALTHASRWGADGYPVRKCLKRWVLDHPLVTKAPLFTRKVDAVNHWEVQLATWRRLSGLEAQERARREQVNAEAS